MLLLRLLPSSSRSSTVRLFTPRRVFLRPVARSRSSLKCLGCNEPFVPSPHNRSRQRFCTKPACKRASKKASQSTWASKPANRDYFKGAHHVSRVRQWRKANPGYSKRSRARKPPAPATEPPPDQTQPVSPQPDPQESLQVSAPPPLQDLGPALQDLVFSYPALVVGLVALQSGSALQDDIHHHLHRVASKGAEILRQGAGRFPPPS